MSCEITKDKTWEGQYYCATHCVWYRDDDEHPSGRCPAGEREAQVEREAQAVREENQGWKEAAGRIKEMFPTKTDVDLSPSTLVPFMTGVKVRLEKAEERAIERVVLRDEALEEG